MASIPPGLHRRRLQQFTLRTETVNFRFGTRSITATGRIADREHPNVRLLTIQPSTVSRFVTALTALLPKPIQAFIRRWFPEWFLPSAIVLKTQKPRWEEEFDLELANYKALQSLQGVLIPCHYGIAYYQGIRSHVMSDIGGLNICETEETSPEAVPVIGEMLRQAIATLAHSGFSQGDLRIANFHVVGDKMMMIDLEQVYLEPSIEYAEKLVKHSVSHIIRQYKNYQEAVRDGWVDW
ncbi:hypothetical protein PT974_01423 [Cladobotryum mycophilum]|uniref:Uncharacterized protein n=1 Tax=Cladobotryum mycophilum TaxID=491253 RepID=A0ABR0T4Y5_9HYPO